MKKKTLLSVILAALLSLCGLFSGCDTNENSNSSPTPETVYTLLVEDIALLVGTQYKPDFSLKANGEIVETAVIEYRSLNTETVSVANGKLKAEKLGTATVEAVARVDGAQVAQGSFSCKVNENKGIHPVKSSYTLYISESVKGVSFATSSSLTAFVYTGGEIVENAEIVWTVGDENIASIDEKGVLQAVAVGETYVVGTYENANGEQLKTVQLPVSVEIPVLTISDDVIVDKTRTMQVLNAQKILGENEIGFVFNPSLDKTYTVENNELETLSFKSGEHTCVFYNAEKTRGVEASVVAADFVIYTKEDLLLLPTFTSGYIVLANDIADVDYVDGGNQRTFTGIFNGLGHTISNIKFKTSKDAKQSSWGLFFRVNGATIKNISITGATLEQASGGAFFYQTQGGETIVDNTFVEITWGASVWQVGGAFGYVWRGSVIYSNSVLIANGPANGSNGLLAGRNNSQTIVKNGYVLGNGFLCGTSNKENNNYAVLNRVAGVNYATQEEFVTAIQKGKTDFSGFNKYWDFSADIPRM